MPRKPGVKKVPAVIRLSEEAKRMLDKLARKNGVSLAAYAEGLVRREAKREGVNGDPEG